MESIDPKEFFVVEFFAQIQMAFLLPGIGTS
jgi:hypothetical protein